MFAVSHKFRRRGIGRELMSSLEALCREMGVAKLYLEVRHRDKCCTRLYSSLVMRCMANVTGVL